MQRLIRQKEEELAFQAQGAEQYRPCQQGRVVRLGQRARGSGHVEYGYVHFFFLSNGDYPGALCMLGEHSTTKLHAQSHIFKIYFLCVYDSCT